SNWIFHDFGWKYGYYDFRVWRETDGKGLTVWVTGDTGAKRWVFRDGAWNEQPWPKDRYGGARAGVPVKLGDQFYARVGFQTENLSPPQRAAMIRSNLLPGKPLVLKIGRDGQIEELDAETTLAAGPYKIPLKSPMWNDAEGAFYASCGSAEVGGRNLGPGLLRCDPSGQEARYATAGSGPPVDIAHLGAMPLVLDGGKRAWTAQGLLDMEKLTQLGQLPRNAYVVVTATDDGAIAFAERNGARLDMKFAPQKVFRFDAPEA